MIQPHSFKALVLCSALVGCSGAKAILDQVAQSADTHDSLYASMIARQEEACGILESIHSVDDARAAKPRLDAMAKQYRDLSNRFLLLGMPDGDGVKRLVDKFGEREHRLADRVKATTEAVHGGTDTTLATVIAFNEFSTAQRDFRTKQAYMRIEKVSGKSAPSSAPADTSQIAEHERAFDSLAGRLNKITALVDAINDADSAKAQLAPLDEALAGVKADIQHYRDLPRVGEMQLQIKLEPAIQRFGDALKQYNQAMDATRQRPGVRGSLIGYDIRLKQAVQQLTIPKMSERKPYVPASPHVVESPGAKKAREISEAIRARRGAPPSSPAKP